jgi:hypothetical protein
MKMFERMSLWGAALALCLLPFVSGCGDDGTTTPTNYAPVITSVTVIPGSVQAGGTATVTVVATDQNGDALTYSYAPNGGSISGSGSSVIWTAPSQAGSYSVAVTVSDGKGGTATGSGTLTVAAAATGITGTITAPGGVQVDLRNMLVRLYDSVGSYQNDTPFTYVTAQGSEYTVTFTFTNLPPGTYYLDAWKDMDGGGTYTVGDVWSVYATGAWPNWTVAPVAVTQGNMTNCSGGMITFLL